MSFNDKSIGNIGMYLPKSVREEEVDEQNLFNASLTTAHDFSQLMERDTKQLEDNQQLMKKAMSQAARNALVNQDPCTIPDDLREELMRQKRKEEAYKTALCDSYRRTGNCAYGEDCRFAHGVSELRMPHNPRGRNHPKYKTVLCDKFSMTGVCKYGVRCQFIHKVKNPLLLAQTNGLIAHSSQANFNQSMFVSQFEDEQQQQQQFNSEMNQSLPLRQSDLSRAFARAVTLDQNESITRITKACERSFVRHNLSSFQWN